jgi:amino acid adenylation domain-containing protein
MGSDSLTARFTNLSPAKRALFELRLKEKSLESLVTSSTPRRVASDSAPLSFAQQRLWFLNQLEPERPAYNESHAVRLSGSLDRDAFKMALNQVVLRHEVLRTTIVTVDGSPCQLVVSNRDVDLPVIDLHAVPNTDRGSEAQRLIAETIRKPFDLSRDLMLRVLLLQLAEKEYIFLVVKHHIASDGWSSGILWKELTALYEAFVSGEPSPLPELPVQYADYAVWQRDWLQGEVLERQLSYWKKQLAGLGALQLPTDRPRPAVQSYRGKRQNLELSKQLSQKLSDLSRQQGTTLFMTLLAAFQTLLYRYTGQEDIVVGCPIAGRTRQEFEGLIGFFVNTLVMRVNFSGNPTFRELLARVREVALAAYAHQDLPFEKLVEEVQPERNLSYTPLFQIAFAYQNTPHHELKIPGVLVTPVEKSVETTKFDLHLSVNSAGEGIEATLYYATDLYDDVTIARLLGHWRVLLEGIVENPHRRLSELPILTEAEEHQLLIEWNDTRRDYPKDKCIHRLFEQQVEKSFDAIAVVFEDQQLTYRELNSRANRLAHYLQKQGVGAESLVGICMERSLEMVVGLLGILKAGAAYVPLDPEYPKERLAFMLEDTRAPVLLTQQRFIDGLPAHNAYVVCLDADWGAISKESVENPDDQVSGAETSYVIYTSGSTGTPKGVAVPHSAVNRLVISTNYINLTSDDVVAQISNCSFDAATLEIWGALLNGARLAIITKDIVLAPEQFAGELKRHGITTLFLTTALFNLVAREVPGAFRQLRHLLFGGEAAEPRWVAKVLQDGPPERLLHVYGPTETTTFATWQLVDEVPDGATTIPIGRPIASTTCYILDAYGQPVPIGVAGEMYIGGDGLAREYLNRPELTAEKFIPHPFSHEPGPRLYKTGDLARYLPNGNIEFLGRIDHQVKIRGFRIELGEIEAILEQHPTVRETVVLTREDEPRDIRLVAYVVSEQSPAPSPGELVGFLKSKLPSYMIPSTFVSLEALPLTPNGKVDRRALPAPAEHRPEMEEIYVAPRTPMEEMIAGIWAEVLKVEKVGIHDNFFDVGGHSLLATQVLSRVREAVRVDLALRVLFEAPTVAELALTVEHGISNSSEFSELARDLTEVESLSDHEIERHLHANTRR